MRDGTIPHQEVDVQRKPTKNTIRATIAGIAMPWFVGCSAASPAPQASPSAVAIAGPDEMVLGANQFRCGGSGDDAQAVPDVPDAPPRLLRRADGKIMMIAAHYNNIPWFSTDALHFARKDCGSILRSNSNGNPAAFDDKGWIVGLSSRDGKSVFALVHNEYHGAAYIPACRTRLKPGEQVWAPVCLQISMRGYVSYNQGDSFTALAVDSPVLATTNDVVTMTDAHSLTRVGLHDPSNIVRNPADGFFYFVVAADPSPRQVSGLCLLRSKDPLTQPWLAWDGKGFNARMGSPYIGAGSACVPVKPWGTYISAISYNTVLKKFLAIGRTDQRQLVALTSTDLIHWGPNILLRSSVQMNWWRPFVGDPDPDSYYTIVDPSSTSLSFDTSGANPYIYYVHFNTSLTKVLSRQRDIMRTQLKVTALK